MEKICHSNSNQEKAAIIASDKQVLKQIKYVTRDKEGYFVMMKMSIHQENITIINMYAPKNRATKYMQ